MTQPIHSKLLNMESIELRPRTHLTQSHVIVIGEIAWLKTNIAQSEDYDERCDYLLRLADAMFLLVDIEREFARRDALHIKQ